MKRIFFLALVVISTIAVYSQEASSVVVVLKNGTEIAGKVKEFDPTTKIVLSVGGFDTTINMSEVNSVTDVTPTQTPANVDSTKSEIYETAINLPKDTIVNICGVDVKFILIKGGKFKYGFDGRGSIAMESEPVHNVVLSPYYVSEEFVSRDLYEAVMKTTYTPEFSIKYADKEIDDGSLQRCAFFMSETLAKNSKLPSVEEFIKTLQNSCGDIYDIPTEVQWFFCESRKSRETTKLKTPALLYCQFALRVSMLDMQDPVGQAVVVKGSTKHDDNDEFDTYRLHDRSQIKRTNIVWWRNNEYKINKKSTLYGMSTLCPIRLVMRVNQ